MKLRRIRDAANELNIPVGTIQAIRFNSVDRTNSKGVVIPGNGFAEAFLKLVGAVYVDTERFLHIWFMKNGRTYAPPPPTSTSPPVWLCNQRTLPEVNALPANSGGQNETL